MLNVFFYYFIFIFYFYFYFLFLFFLLLFFYSFVIVLSLSTLLSSLCFYSHFLCLLYLQGTGLHQVGIKDTLGINKGGVDLVSWEKGRWVGVLFTYNGFKIAKNSRAPISLFASGLILGFTCLTSERIIMLYCV